MTNYSNAFVLFVSGNDKGYLIMDLGYTWILWQGEIYCKFSLLTWTSFIGQLIHPVGGEGWGKEGDGYFSQLQVSLY